MSNIKNDDELTLTDIRKANVDRDKEIGSHLDRWNEFECFAILAEEVGEVANAINNINKKDKKDVDLPSELADVLLSVDLLAHICGVDLDEAVRETFNRKSDKWGCNTKL